MRIVLVEPYYGGSHKAWADGYASSSRNDVTVISHEARFWKWRMHGSFVTLAAELENHVAEHGPPDVIVASSMMDVSAFAGAVRSLAPGVPIAAYFHESQFTYPLSPADRVDQTYAMKNWASAATADLVIFNSEFHRSVFRAEARALLNSFPDHKHIELVDPVVDRSIVLPVGIEASQFGPPARASDEPPLIVWNHRWEHDKGPHELLAIVEGLIEADVDFTMGMCGEVFVSVPPAYDLIIEALGDRLVHAGWLERTDYIDTLNRASVVLSTSIQEFFGIGVLEGVVAGARPVLPDRLVYPERVESLGADPTEVLYESPEHGVELITASLDRPPDQRLQEVAAAYDWESVADGYDDVLETLAARE
ncbi:MAG: DUF3524 domain-containing protein [Acidimicrobiia bacterium]|nr:DUF3524 domain-containing protein [Acidimicrobiia bacterium]